MRLPTAPRPAATLWTLSLLWLAQCAVAGPVAGDEAASAPMGIEAAAGISTPPLDGSTTTAAGAAVARPASGDSAPAGSALALELLKEAEAGAQANEAQRRTARPEKQAASAPAPTGPTSRSQANNAEADGGLREMGKSAVHWLKESLPWLRTDAEDDDRRHNAMPGAADWSESPLEGAKADRAGSVGPAHGSAFVQAGPDTAVIYGGSAQRTQEPQHNIFTEFIQLLRIVLEHPMTWLIVSLFVVGGFALRKFDRRPR
jgi:hypothetical protein